VQGQAFLAKLGITGIDPSLNYTGLPNIILGGSQVSSFPSLAGIGEVYNPATWLEHRSSVLDNLTWQKGKHTIKMGGNYTLFNGKSEGASSNPFGTYNFTGRMTTGTYAVGGSSWADLLLGYPDNTVRFTPRATTLPRNFMWGAYVQDDWKVTPRLTINYGVRWDLEGAPIDKAGLYYGFDMNNGSLVFPSQYAMNHVSKLFNNLIPLELNTAAGQPAHLIPTSKTDFRPRLGFAFRPFNNAQTVIRAGYGVYTNGKLGTAMNRVPASAYLQSTGPFALSETFISQFGSGGGATSGTPTLSFPSPFLASSGPNQSASYGVGFVTPNYRDPYVQQWNLSLEQEYWKTAFRFSYIGSKSTNLLWGRDINQMKPSTTPFDISGCSTVGLRPVPTCRRNYYGYSSVSMTDGGGNAIYHSAQIEFTRPLATGLQLHGGYIWASEITDVEESSYIGIVGTNTYDRKYNRGKSNFIPAQRFQFDFVWMIPVGKGHRALGSAPGIVNQLLGNWTLSGYANYMTGTPFSATYGGKDTTGTGITSGRADRIGSGRLANPTDGQWFDPTAFVVPCGPGSTPTNCTVIGRFGNSGRNIIYGPTNSFDYGRAEQLAIFKTFPIYKERLKFTVGGYFSNPWNHSYQYAPSTVITDTQNVGKVTRYGSRTVQLGGRLEF